MQDVVPRKNNMLHSNYALEGKKLNVRYSQKYSCGKCKHIYGPVDHLTWSFKIYPTLVKAQQCLYYVFLETPLPSAVYSTSGFSHLLQTHYNAWLQGHTEDY